SSSEPTSSAEPSSAAEEPTSSAEGPGNPPAGRADVTVEEPEKDITLTPGGNPAELPITVHNTGDSASEPVQATLELPEGVEVVRSGGGGAAPAGGGAAPASQPQSSQPREISCPPSDGDTATCGTEE